MGKKKRSQLERGKQHMGKLTGKGKHKVTVENHPHTNISKEATMTRGEYKRRKWKIHLKLRGQQLKTILYINTP